MKYPIIFAMLTAFFWGLYGPILGDSRAELKNVFKPYLLIGLAYLLWGVIGGAIGMWKTGADFAFPPNGTMLGFFAGSLGAFGALTLTLAMFTGGNKMPYLVMPIVFGGAVTVSALVSLYKERGHTEINPLLFVGILGVVASAALVAYCTPHAAPPKKPAGSPPAATSAPVVKPTEKLHG